MTTPHKKRKIDDDKSSGGKQLPFTPPCTLGVKKFRWTNPDFVASEEFDSKLNLDQLPERINGNKGVL